MQSMSVTWPMNVSWCGRCLEACPQNAIISISDVCKAKSYIKEGYNTVVSLDPSYLGLFGDEENGSRAASGGSA